MNNLLVEPDGLLSMVESNLCSCQVETCPGEGLLSFQSAVRLKRPTCSGESDFLVVVTPGGEIDNLDYKAFY